VDEVLLRDYLPLKPWTPGAARWEAESERREDLWIPSHPLGDLIRTSIQRSARSLSSQSLRFLLLAGGCFWLLYLPESAKVGLGSHMAALLCLAVMAWLWVQRSVLEERSWMAYLGAICFLGIYAYIRGVMQLGGRQMDPWVLLCIGALLLAFRERWEEMGGQMLQRVARRISTILPLIVLLLGFLFDKQPALTSWLLAGIFYGVLAHQHKLRWLYLPSLVFLNLGILLFLGERGIDGAHWYILPIGLSFVAVAGFFANELGQHGRLIFRILGMLAIYLSSMIQMFAFYHISHVLWLAVFSILGILAGIAFQIRSFLFLGLGFLVLNLASNLFRIGLQDRVIGMIFLFCSGILLLASAVFFNLKRLEILQSIKKLQDKISSWD
jgi:hypothetical protein